jgi:hypothetical protein
MYGSNSMVYITNTLKNDLGAIVITTNEAVLGTFYFT